MICKYTNYKRLDDKQYYGVEFRSIEGPINVDDVIVQHKEGKSNNDIECVDFKHCNLPRVPQGLTKLFPNLKFLYICESALPELRKMDLVEYRNLKEFSSIKNDVEFVPGDLFEGFKNLEWITFCGMALKVIEPNILNGLDKLKYVCFFVSQIYDEVYSIYPHHFSKMTLKEVKNKLTEKFLSVNVRKIIEKIQEKATKSEQKVQELSIKNQELTNEVKNGNSILCDLKDYISDEKSKDFKIEIDGHEFPVHKLLLTIRSPILAEMLRSNPSAEKMKLVDITVEVFEVILKFLYTDEHPHDDDVNFLHLFDAANRLKIKKLSDYAAMKILNQVDTLNAVDVLDLGNKYRHDELRQRAFEEIKAKYPNVEFEDDWAMDIEKVKKMIEICKELEAVEKKFSTLKH